MINLQITNFKCFHDIEVPINQLTILAGGNGNGKSTIIQSLLLLRRTVEHCAKWDTQHYVYDSINGLNVELNGVYCLNLGNSEHILPSEYEVPKIEFGIECDGTSFHVGYGTNKGNEVWITPELIHSNSYNAPYNPLLFHEFYYLNAERIGPRIAQSIKFYDYYNVGFQGEYTAQIIADLDSLDSENSFIIDANRVLNDKTFLKGSKFQHYVFILVILASIWIQFLIKLSFD